MRLCSMVTLATGKRLAAHVYPQKHVVCFFKLKIACFELAIAKTLYKEYYMHFIDHSTEETDTCSGKSILTIPDPYN